MILVDNYFLAILCCVICCACWGSWANTQKMVAAATSHTDYFNDSRVFCREIEWHYSFIRHNLLYYIKVM